MDKIICLGKNYLEHARELGDAVPERPVLFLKPPSVLTRVVGNSVEVSLPRNRGELHPELEIVLQVNAHGMITAMTLGLDLTFRTLQAQLKKSGHPWEISKVFANSAVLGPLLPIQDFEPEWLDWKDREFQLTVNNQLRQAGRGREMRLAPLQCVALAKEFFPICDGDLIFTGTPAGVGPVSPGDQSQLSWGNKLHFQVNWS